MSRYPRSARDAQMKCIGCNAPVVVTVDGRYVCVDCGESPLTANDKGQLDQTSAASTQGSLVTDGNPSASNGD